MQQECLVPVENVNHALLLLGSLSKDNDNGMKNGLVQEPAKLTDDLKQKKKSQETIKQ